MSSRYGRNKRRRHRERIADLEVQLVRANAQHEREQLRTLEQLNDLLRHHIEAKRVPLVVERFIAPEQRQLLLHTIYDARRANLHYQHPVDLHDRRILEDKQERERFGMYLGRAIADQLADHIAKGTPS